MNIVGVSAFNHDSSVCLLKNGRLIAAASEERFTRIKHDHRLPVESFKYCLREGKVGISQIDCLAFYEDPFKKFDRQSWSINQSTENPIHLPIHPNEILDQIKTQLGYEGQVLYYDHHLCHAASGYYFSGFEESAILTVDGVGEWETITLSHGSSSGINVLETVKFPDSLGLFYSTITAFLGFRVNNGEYKVMGLASFGKPYYYDKLQRLFDPETQNLIKLDLSYFDFVSGTKMFSRKLIELLGLEPRHPNSPLRDHHFNLASSAQLLLEEKILNLVFRLRNLTTAKNLVLAGGTFLNCVSNSKVKNTGIFDDIFIQPAAGDAGGCLGAAALAFHSNGQDLNLKANPFSVYLGPGSKNLKSLISACALPFTDFTGKEAGLLNRIVGALKDGKVVGWFHGRMEFGPRALGARSILADPRDPNMKFKINELIKRREEFRPFGPVVIDHVANHYFENVTASNYMLYTFNVKHNTNIPAATHVDGSSRPQILHEESNSRLYKLLRLFYNETECGALINTSFNLKGEPIVCSAEDALFCFIRSGLDLLVLDEYVFEKSDIPESVRKVVMEMKWDYISFPDEGFNLYSFT